MAIGRPKKYPRRIVLPMTEEQYSRLFENWNGQEPLVDLIRRAMDQVYPAQPKSQGGKANGSL